MSLYISDLERSLLQFRKHEELKYLMLSRTQKFFLGIAFFLLLPFSIFGIFKKNQHNNANTIFVVDYGKSEPFNSIYNAIKSLKGFKFIKISRSYFPILPYIFLKDIFFIIKKKPLYLLSNLDFFGALSLKLLQYYSVIQRNDIQYLILFQEYSFYSSYLTRVMESQEGKLFNIQHGIPGKTYAYFRFSKMFIWGEYFQEQYIKNGADRNQFEIIGSMVHTLRRRKSLSMNVEDIDILFIMQGEQRELSDILEVLEVLSDRYNIQYIQHPRHPVKLNTSLRECRLSLWEALAKSKKVLSHYSTVLFDASWLGKESIAYLSIEQEEYVSYLPKKNIIHNKKDLMVALTQTSLNAEKLSTYYIIEQENPVLSMKKEIEKCLKHTT